MIRTFSFLTFCGLLIIAACTQTPQVERPSEAGEAFRMWEYARIFPDGKFYTEKYTQALAFRQLQQGAVNRNPAWEALGPKNIGGRTLSIAIHPQDTNQIWLGSASGGIWKSETAGIGASAWEYVETGFPVLGVGALAIDPVNPDVIYAGTGEVYNLENSMPNVAIRTTRGIYGIGILKSEDGGETWTKSLDWSYGDMTGVQDIVINPLRHETVYAATTEGTYRSYDSGENWTLVHGIGMAVDVEINPQDTNMVFVSCGSLNDQGQSGIYRSFNGGGLFLKIGNGLPANWSGKALMAMHPQQPNIMMVSIGDAFSQIGLYKTENSGSTWSLVNDTDVCKYQGWYSHDVAMHPTNPDTLIWVGVDLFKSTDGGQNVDQKSSWSAWYFGQVPAGGPEGPPYYVHADMHRLLWVDDSKVYVVTDGGLFVSYDGGENWDGRNGGYQTQQFYANLGNSGSTTDLCIGGMQDNATAIYTGTGDWTRVIGGDGECAAINQDNDFILYGSAQYLNMRRSVDGGESWQGITPPDAGNEQRSFNGPFELAPSNQDILYAGAQSIFRSDDGGDNWYNASAGPLNNQNTILTMAVDPNDANTVWAGTVPSSGSGQVVLYKINAATGAATQFSGLPNRVCMDITVHPLNSDVAYAAFGGFNTEHVWKTTDGGQNWVSVSDGLPDIPTNTIAIDPLYPDIVYVGTDVGVWVSKNGGDSWETYSEAAPGSFLVMHLSVAPGRKLRAATFGLGVWQADMAEPLSTQGPYMAFSDMKVFPVPAKDYVNVAFTLEQTDDVRFMLVSADGKVLRNWEKRFGSGDMIERIDLGDVRSGPVFVVTESDIAREVRSIIISR